MSRTLALALTLSLALTLTLTLALALTLTLTLTLALQLPRCRLRPPRPRQGSTRAYERPRPRLPRAAVGAAQRPAPQLLLLLARTVVPQGQARRGLGTRGASRRAACRAWEATEPAGSASAMARRSE